MNIKEPNTMEYYLGTIETSNGKVLKLILAESKEDAKDKLEKYADTMSTYHGGEIEVIETIK